MFKKSIYVDLSSLAAVLKGNVGEDLTHLSLPSLSYLLSKATKKPLSTTLSGWFPLQHAYRASDLANKLLDGDEYGTRAQYGILSCVSIQMGNQGGHLLGCEGYSLNEKEQSTLIQDLAPILVEFGLQPLVWKGPHLLVERLERPTMDERDAVQNHNTAGDISSLSSTSSHTSISSQGFFTDVVIVTPSLYSSINSDLGSLFVREEKVNISWMKLFNHLQLFLNNHPVNVNRIQLGQKPIEALWFWEGASDLSLSISTLGASAASSPSILTASSSSSSSYLNGFDQFLGDNWLADTVTLSDFISDFKLDALGGASLGGSGLGNTALYSDDSFFEACLYADKDKIISSLQSLENELFTILVDAYLSKEIQSIILVIEDSCYTLGWLEHYLFYRRIKPWWHRFSNPGQYSNNLSQ